MALGFGNAILPNLVEQGFVVDLISRPAACFAVPVGLSSACRMASPSASSLAVRASDFNPPLDSLPGLRNRRGRRRRAIVAGLQFGGR